MWINFFGVMLVGKIKIFSVFALLYLLIIVGLPFFIIKLLIINSSFLVLLILRHQIIHIRLSFSELHLVHTLSSVPVKESLSPEHGSELLGDPLEQLLDGGGVADERGSHLESSWRNIADSSLDIVRNPLNKVG